MKFSIFFVVISEILACGLTVIEQADSKVCDATITFRCDKSPFLAAGYGHLLKSESEERAIFYGTIEHVQSTHPTNKGCV